MLAVWQGVALRSGAGILPLPLDVVRALGIGAADGTLLRDSLVTLGNVLMSFAIALLGGVALALAAMRSRVLTDFLHPLMVMLESAPTIAWLVLAILWLGLGAGPSIAVGISMTLPLLYLSTLHALQQEDQGIMEMAQVFGVSRMRRLLRIVFPSLALTLAGTASGALSVAWRGVIMAEAFSSTHGLGPLLWGSYLYGEITQVYADILWIVLLGLLLEYAFIHPVRLWILSRLHHAKT
ncbi:putative aliphatic sulfonates transport permease protein SsuC [mine drainage metagenome]|uniref:Putative aliphatic sulfonates transport permease protein SsuC n=1 Tax=mine drainage metagenome TaxID=410659 RepID=A0A1J5PGP6_9ZZZZ